MKQEQIKKEEEKEHPHLEQPPFVLLNFEP